MGQGRFGLQGTWSRSDRLSEDVADRGCPCATPCAGRPRFVVLRERLILEGSTDYDFVRKELLQAHAKAEWNVQCCGFAVEYIQYNYNAPRGAPVALLRPPREHRRHRQLPRQRRSGRPTGRRLELQVKVLITGVGGFVGGHLVAFLRREHPEVESSA